MHKDEITGLNSPFVWLCLSQPEGVEGEVMYLSRERQILVLQMEALRRENQQAEAGLETLNRLHQQEVHSIREESLQVGDSLQGRKLQLFIKGLLS